MVDFEKYQHIERLGSDEVDGILDGTCYVFPKIDGTNASVWLDAGGELWAGSRNRTLSLESDNAGFFKWVMDNQKLFLPILHQNPGLRLFGEWLVPHTLRTYREDAWRRFYVFDVWHDTRQRHLHYEEYAGLVDSHGIDYVPPIEIVTNPTQEHLVKLLERNTYLIDDGNGSGEGIVIKRYDYRNRYGRQTWAKLVRNEFKERNLAAFGTPTVEMGAVLEQRLALEYVTPGRVAKVVEKMRETGPLSSRRIPELLNRVWNDVVVEETWSILKDHKNPTIDFKVFNRAVIAETKRNCPELFGVSQ
jgi:hypothetical protein